MNLNPDHIRLGLDGMPLLPPRMRRDVVDIVDPHLAGLKKLAETNDGCSNKSSCGSSDNSNLCSNFGSCKDSTNLSGCSNWDTCSFQKRR